MGLSPIHGVRPRLLVFSMVDHYGEVQTEYWDVVPCTSVRGANRRFVTEDSITLAFSTGLEFFWERVRDRQSTEAVSRASGFFFFRMRTNFVCGLCILSEICKKILVNLLPIIAFTL